VRATNKHLHKSANARVHNSDLDPHVHFDNLHMLPCWPDLLIPLTPPVSHRLIVPSANNRIVCVILQSPEYSLSIPSTWKMEILVGSVEVERPRDGALRSRSTVCGWCLTIDGRLTAH
jgi:hypothetical protein